MDPSKEDDEDAETVTTIQHLSEMHEDRKDQMIKASRQDLGPIEYSKEKEVTTSSEKGIQWYGCYTES